MRKNKTCVSAGNEMEFNNKIYRDPVEIVSNWGSYFKSLYTPSENIKYDSVFKETISSYVKTVNNTLFSNR